MREFDSHMSPHFVEVIMNYAKIRKMDISNGPGVRVSLFVSGCSHHCKNCFNPETWNFNYGNKFTKVEINKIVELLKPSYIRGLSLLGGEPFEPANQSGVLELVKVVKNLYPNKDIWAWTGFMFDKDFFNNKFIKNSNITELLQYIDVIVDGKFIEKLKNPKLMYRGSSNQRVIDVQKSIRNGKIIKLNFTEQI